MVDMSDKDEVRILASNLQRLFEDKMDELYCAIDDLDEYSADFIELENLRDEVSTWESLAREREDRICELEEELNENDGIKEAEWMLSLYRIDTAELTDQAKHISLAETLINDLARIVGISMCSKLV